MSFVAIAALVTTALGGGAGMTAFLQVRSTNRKIVSEAKKLQAEGRKTQAEGGEAYVRASDLSVESMVDVVTFHGQQLKACHEQISELKKQLRERDGIIDEQGILIRSLRVRVSQLEDLGHLPRREIGPVPPDV